MMYIIIIIIIIISIRNVKSLFLKVSAYTGMVVINKFANTIVSNEINKSTTH